MILALLFNNRHPDKCQNLVPYHCSDGRGLLAAGNTAPGAGEVGPPGFRAEGVSVAKVRVSSQAFPAGI